MSSSDIQVRIFTEAFLNTAESQLSGKISLRGEELVDTDSSAFGSDNSGHLLDELRVERAAHADGGVEDGAIENQDAVETFTLDKGGNT